MTDDQHVHLKSGGTKKKWIIVYTLAAVVVLGRIGSYGSEGFVQGILRIVPITGSESVGAMLESLMEDALVFFAVRNLISRSITTTDKENAI